MRLFLMKGVTQVILSSLLLVSLLNPVRVAAQMYSPPQNVPSPQAFEFNKYGGLEPNLFNGLPKISIPLNSIDLGGYTFSAALSYDASGFRPDAHPGIVGMNWNLDVGGAITRKVRGLPDEFKFSITYNSQLGSGSYDYNNGYLFNSVLNNYSFHDLMKTQSPIYTTTCGGPSYPTNHILPYIADHNYYLAPDYPKLWDASGGVSCGKGEIWFGGNSYFGSWIQNGMKDAQPDEFVFNALGISGSFYFKAKPPYTSSTDWNEVFAVRCNRKVKVIPILNASGNNVNLYKLPFNPPLNGDQATSVNRFNNYSPWHRMGEYPQTLTGFKLVLDDGTVLTFGRFVADGLPGDGGFSSLPIEFSMAMYNGNDYWRADSWYLSNVSYPNGRGVDLRYERGEFIASKFLSVSTYTLDNSSINFDCYSDPINGCKSGSIISPVYLSTVSSKDFRWSFSRGNSVQIPLELDLSILGSFFASYNQAYAGFKDKWYQLNSIKFEDYGGEKYANFQYSSNSAHRLLLNELSFTAPDQSPVKHQFEYNGVPDVGYITQEQDHWGFWNGVVEPAYLNNLSGYGSLRTPSLAHCSKGILKKVIYPTGGHTEYVYELNKYSSKTNPSSNNVEVLAADVFAGGLRVKETKDVDHISGNTIVKKYFYTKNFDPDYPSQGTSSGVLSVPIQYYWEKSNAAVMAFTGGFDPGQGYARFFSSQPLYYNFDGYHIGYSEVAILGPDNSFTVKRFTNHDNGFGDELGINNVTSEITPFNRKSSKKFERGHLLEERVYNSGKVLMRSKEYEYYRKYHPNAGSNSLELWDAVVLLNKSSIDPPLDQISIKYGIYGNSYKFYTYSFLPSKEVVKEYSNGETLVSQKDYVYGNVNHNYPTEEVFYTEDGIRSIRYKYVEDFPQGEFIMSMFRSNNMFNTLIERISLKKLNNEAEYRVVGADLNEYCLNPNGSSGRPVLKAAYTAGLNGSVTLSAFTPTAISTIDLSNGSYVKDASYRKVYTIKSYNTNSRPTTIAYESGLERRLSYGFYMDELVSDISSSDKYSTSIIGSEGFEKYTYYEDFSQYTGVLNSGIWENYDNKITTGGFAGTYALQSALRSNQTFSYVEFHLWAKSDLPKPILNQIDGNGNISIPLSSSACFLSQNGWCLYKYYLPAVSKVYINPNGNLVDEVRFCALGDGDRFGGLSSYSYKNGKLVASINGDLDIRFYEYDLFGRLVLVRDGKKNILNRYCYNYAGQPEPCKLYGNQLKSQTFTRNNCAPGMLPGVYNYSVAANQFYAESQAAADALAQAEIDANGQNVANTNATCSYGNTIKSGTFIKNNCNLGETGSSVIYTVAANTYTSTVSQAAADALAQADVDANGQAYANTTGTCTSTSGCVPRFCRGEGQKCVNNNCEWGVKVYTSATYNPSTMMWTCAYHYEFSDGSWSWDYYETSYRQCILID